MQFTKSLVGAAGVVALLAFTPAIAANNANFGQVMSSIQASKTGATDIQAMTTLKSVNVVMVNDLAKGENIAALDAAVTKNNTDISALRTAMTSNTAVNQALVDAKVDVSTVVAADIANDGILTVYVR
ncbi:MAG TPA: hypothetical protein VM144_00830 [Aestuariivirga sp.]|nr:hypothetical protein [Aestuariivirga sp.]